MSPSGAGSWIKVISRESLPSLRDARRDNGVERTARVHETSNLGAADRVRFVPQGSEFCNPVATWKRTLARSTRRLRMASSARTPMSNHALFIERRIPRGQGTIYARDYEGGGPTFVLMHGFPDNLQIYDRLVPYLVAAGRRVVTLDFLGYGASDKPADV